MESDVWRANALGGGNVCGGIASWVMLLVVVVVKMLLLLGGWCWCIGGF